MLKLRTEIKTTINYQITQNIKALSLEEFIENKERIAEALKILDLEELNNDLIICFGKSKKVKAFKKIFEVDRFIRAIDLKSMIMFYLN